MLTVVDHVGKNSIQSSTVYLRSVWEAVVPTDVVVLFLSCCPSAILRGVVTVVVDAVDAVLRAWTAPHVFEKVLVGLPTFTDLNPPSSIVAERLVVGVVASPGQRGPRAVFGSHLTTAIGRFPVLELCVAHSNGEFTSEAPTGLGSTCCKRFTLHDCSVPAITLTDPLGMTVSPAGRSFKYNESAKPLTDDVVNFHGVHVSISTLTRTR